MQERKKITRLAVIMDGERCFEKYNIKVEEDIQDDGRTLKMFVTRKE